MNNYIFGYDLSSKPDITGYGYVNLDTFANPDFIDKVRDYFANYSPIEKVVCGDPDCFCTCVEPEIEAEEKLAETFKTKGNCYYTIADDEELDAVRLEISPDWAWSKDDLRELISTLEDLVDDEPEAETFVVSYPGVITENQAILVRDMVRKQTGMKNVLVLSEGAQAYRA